MVLKRGNWIKKCQKKNNYPRGLWTTLMIEFNFNLLTRFLKRPLYIINKYILEDTNHIKFSFNKYVFSPLGDFKAKILEICNEK